MLTNMCLLHFPWLLAWNLLHLPRILRLWNPDCWSFQFLLFFVPHSSMRLTKIVILYSLTFPKSSPGTFLPTKFQVLNTISCFHDRLILPHRRRHGQFPSETTSRNINSDIYSYYQVKPSAKALSRPTNILSIRSLPGCWRHIVTIWVSEGWLFRFYGHHVMCWHTAYYSYNGGYLAHPHVCIYL